MATDHHESHAEHLGNPDVAYERRDLGARGILLFFAILFISGVIIHFVVWGVYGAMSKVVANMDPPANPLKPFEKAPQAALLQNTPMTNLNKFPEPRLQSNDVVDMDTFRWQQEQILHGQPWQDPSGAVHIPIEQAMKLVAQRGLPTRTGAPGVGTVASQIESGSKPASDQRAAGGAAAEKP